ncbi:MAG: hypothetical protein LAP40_23560 [Acidobacteriia bacterium]|nr:hypothetical protein [Terriglobia bacterium]
MKRRPPLQGFRRLTDVPTVTDQLRELLEARLTARSIRYKRHLYRRSGRIPASGEPTHQPFWRFLIYIRDLAIAQDVLAELVAEHFSSPTGETQASGVQRQGQRIGAFESIQ